MGIGVCAESDVDALGSREYGQIQIRYGPDLDGVGETSEERS